MIRSKMSSSDNVLGSISKPFISAFHEFDEFEWSINDPCSAETLDNKSYLESPTFSFSNCSWCIKIFPKEATFSSALFLSLSLVKKKSQSEKNISLSVIIIYQGILLNYETATYTFPKTEDNWEWTHCIPKYQLFRTTTRAISQLCIRMTLNQKAFSKKDTLLDVKMQDKVLHQNYRDLLLHDTEHDLILKVKDKEFKVHQKIMRFRCPVFKLMLDHDMLERNSGIVEIPDCDPLAFEQFLFYVYTGNVEALDESFMLSLYYIADKYDMAHLKEMCSELIKKSLSNHNVYDVIRLAWNHSDLSLLESGNTYFADNAREFLQTAEWRSFMNENPNPASELLLKHVYGKNYFQ